MLQICLPIVFLAGLLSTRLARSVVGTLVVDLQTPVPPGDLRGLLARTLADPSVDIVYPLDGTDRWIGSDSAPASLPVPGTGHAARSRCAATTRPGYRRVIRSVTAPVLLLHGERDRLVPVAAARAAARRNPGWMVRILPSLGHVPQLEAPQTIATAVRDWLDAHPSTTGGRG